MHFLGNMKMDMIEWGPVFKAFMVQSHYRAFGDWHV